MRTHYKVEEMRTEARGRDSFHPFCEVFHRLRWPFVFVWFVLFLWFLVLFLLSKPVESLLQVIPGLFFFAFAFLES